MGCLSVGGPVAEVLRRCNSRLGRRVLEELGVEGDGELGGAVPAPRRRELRVLLVPRAAEWPEVR